MRNFHHPQHCIVEIVRVGTELDLIFGFNILNIDFEQGVVDGFATLALFASALLNFLFGDSQGFLNFAHDLDGKVQIASHDQQVVEFDEFD